MNEATPIWLWAESPAELLRSYVIANNAPTSIPPETVPFACPALPLGGGLHYQIALSDSKACPKAATLRNAQPAIPISGDVRSGILVLDGDRVVGSHVFEKLGPYTLQVLQNYRGRGIAGRMYLQYFKEVMTLHGRTAIIAPLAVKAFVSAHARIVRWAVQTGKDVPQRVIDAVESGQEAAHLLRRVGIAA